MQVRRFSRAEEFLARAQQFLVAHEAHNNLLLGICATLIQHGGRSEQPAYLATVEADNTIVGAAVMTPPHNLVLSLMTQSDAPALIVQDLQQVYADIPGVLGPSAISRAFAERWQVASGKPFRLGMAQCVYQLERVEPTAPVSGRLQRAVATDRALLVEWVTAFSVEAGLPVDLRGIERTVAIRLADRTSGLFLWCDPAPVALAGSTGPTPNGIRIAPVYTPPEHRRKGYATALVARLSQTLLDEGRRYCFLFTDLSNPTSNHIYQAIGYQPIATIDEYWFERS